MYPIGRIPTLKKGSFVLGESNAILIYLCETNPHLQCYYGDTPGQRATVNQYLSWYQNYFRPALFKPVRLYLGSIMRNLPILEEHKRALDTDMLEAVDELEKLLQKRKGQFIAGPHLTIADLLFFFELTNLSLFGKSYIDRPALQRWSD